jgi:hypothetical protein
VTVSTYEISLDGGILQRGFWLYVWEVTTPEGNKLLYVGRTGDSSSPNAQSPFNRMSQHLGFVKTSCTLRNHLDERKIAPELCSFRLQAYGPILDEADGMEVHKSRRDLIAALEKQLAEDLDALGYDVINKVNCLKQLDEEIYADVHAAFVAEFPVRVTRVDLLCGLWWANIVDSIRRPLCSPPC